MYELNDSHISSSVKVQFMTYRDVGQLVLIVLHGVRPGMVQQQQDFTTRELELVVQVENPRLEHFALNPSLLV